MSTEPSPTARPMRILHLVNHCRLGHGNVHAAVDLACIQAEKGDVVAYAGEGGELQDVLAGSGVEHVQLRQRSKDPRHVLGAILSVRRLIRQRELDIVHAHMMAGAVIGYCATRFTRAALVTTVHNSFDGHAAIMRLGDRIVAVSEAERRALAASGFSAERLAAIVNAPLGGVRSRSFASDPEVEVARPSITTVCGLHERKGVDTIIAAFALLAPGLPAELHIVGDGPDRAKLEAMARETGFGARIHFHGELRDPQKVLTKTDIFVLASHAEPFGLVNLEARHAGCAIVASNVGGVPEALDDGRAGVLVPPREAAAFAKEITALLSDPARLAEMKRRAASGLERFGVDRLYANYRRVYASLQAASPARRASSSTVSTG